MALAIGEKFAVTCLKSECHVPTVALMVILASLGIVRKDERRMCWEKMSCPTDLDEARNLVTMFNQVTKQASLNLRMRYVFWPPNQDAF